MAKLLLLVLLHSNAASDKIMQKAYLLKGYPAFSEIVSPFLWKALCMSTFHPGRYPLFSIHSFQQIDAKLSSLITTIQFSSVTQSCITLCNPREHSMPGFPVHHQLLGFTQNHVHWLSDAIQSSHPLSSPSPPTFNLSQHQGLFKWVSSWHEVAKVLEFQLQHQSLQWIFRTDLL